MQSAHSVGRVLVVRYFGGDSFGLETFMGFPIAFCDIKCVCVYIYILYVYRIVEMVWFVGKAFVSFHFVLSESSWNY